MRGLWKVFGPNAEKIVVDPTLATFEFLHQEPGEGFVPDYLLPDPALSTGYGQRMIERGWGRWGSEPYTDLMTITDAAEERTDVDETRTAAMGGSFGGYMVNWIAGAWPDRFRCLVHRGQVHG